MKLGELARNDVPLLARLRQHRSHLGKVTRLAIESIYQQLGGRISVMIKDGVGHHPHSLRDPKPIADFIVAERCRRPARSPACLRGRANSPGRLTTASRTRTGTFRRKGRTSPVADRSSRSATTAMHSIWPASREPITVIVPEDRGRGKALGIPGRFRTAAMPVVDLALLAKGFHIVTGPVPYNADGPCVQHWNAVYKHLTDNGFSKKPVMEGAGAAAGEAYAWAIANPDKVSCIYGENPVLRSTHVESRRWTTWRRWPRPACRSCTFAAVSTRGSTSRRAWPRNATRNSAARSLSSSRKAKGIIRWRRRTRSRSWISSSMQFVERSCAIR